MYSKSAKSEISAEKSRSSTHGRNRNATQIETVLYIKDMTRQMGSLARAHGLGELSYLLSVASAEALRYVERKFESPRPL